jgi:hypothetical protein
VYTATSNEILQHIIPGDSFYDISWIRPQLGLVYACARTSISAGHIQGGKLTRNFLALYTSPRAKNCSSSAVNESSLSPELRGPEYPRLRSVRELGSCAGSAVEKSRIGVEQAVDQAADMLLSTRHGSHANTQVKLTLICGYIPSAA